MKRKKVLELVKDELDRAQRQHGPLNSAHEGYAVLKEEVDELWDEIRANNGTKHRGTSEAVQIAAMAMRYLIDLCDDTTAVEHTQKVADYTPSYGGGGGYSG